MADGGDPVPPDLPIQGAKPCCVSFNADISQITAQVLLAALVARVSEGFDEVHLLMNTPGGDVSQGISLYNAIRALPVRVVTYNMGSVDSIGNVVFQAGDYRVCAHQSSFMFHGVITDLRGSLDLKQLQEQTRGIENGQSLIADVMVNRTSRPRDEITALFSQMAFLKADEAVESGVADEVRDIHLPRGLPITPLVFQ